MAKAKNIPRPVKRRRKAKVAAAHESAKEFAERQAAEWVQSNPGLVKRLKRFAEPPGEAELAERGELAAARKEMARYIAIRDNQIPPPWLKKNKLGRPLKPAENSKPKGPLMDLLLPALRETYPPDGIPPDGLELRLILIEIRSARGLVVSRKVLSLAIKYLKSVRRP